MRSFPRIVLSQYVFPFICGYSTIFFGLTSVRSVHRIVLLAPYISAYFITLAATLQLVSIANHEINTLGPSLVCIYGAFPRLFLLRYLLAIASHEIDSLEPSSV